MSLKLISSTSSITDFFTINNPESMFVVKPNNDLDCLKKFALYFL